MTVQLKVLKTSLWDCCCFYFLSCLPLFPQVFLSPFTSLHLALRPMALFCRGCPLSLSQTLASCSSFSCILMQSWVNLPPLTPPNDLIANPHLTDFFLARQAFMHSLQPFILPYPPWPAVLSLQCQHVCFIKMQAQFLS